MRIVIMDDDIDIRSTLKEILEQCGYEVYAFENPEICPLQLIPDCLCKENERCTDLIITDIDMPGMNGIEFLQNHRSKSCHCTEVIVISGMLREETIQRVTALGCEIFEKPLNFDKLTAYIAQLESKIPTNRVLRDWFKEVVPS